MLRRGFDCRNAKVMIPFELSPHRRAQQLEPSGLPVEDVATLHPRIYQYIRLRVQTTGVFVISPAAESQNLSRSFRHTFRFAEVVELPLAIPIREIS
jgi:hypothetical protein